MSNPRPLSHSYALHLSISPSQKLTDKHLSPVYAFIIWRLLVRIIRSKSLRCAGARQSKPLPRHQTEQPVPCRESFCLVEWECDFSHLSSQKLIQCRCVPLTMHGSYRKANRLWITEREMRTWNHSVVARHSHPHSLGFLYVIKMFITPPGWINLAWLPLLRVGSRRIHNNEQNCTFGSSESDRIVFANVIRRWLSCHNKRANHAGRKAIHATDRRLFAARIRSGACKTMERISSRCSFWLILLPLTKCEPTFTHGSKLARGQKSLLHATCSLIRYFLSIMGYIANRELSCHPVKSHHSLFLSPSSLELYPRKLKEGYEVWWRLTKAGWGGSRERRRKSSRVWSSLRRTLSAQNSKSRKAISSSNKFNRKSSQSNSNLLLFLWTLLPATHFLSNKKPRFHPHCHTHILLRFLFPSTTTRTICFSCLTEEFNPRTQSWFALREN